MVLFLIKFWGGRGRGNSCFWKGRTIERVKIPTRELRAFCIQKYYA